MKNKTTLLIIIIVFVLLLGGSYLLYNNLSPNINADRLAVRDDSQNENEQSEDKTDDNTQNDVGKKTTTAMTTAIIRMIPHRRKSPPPTLPFTIKAEWKLNSPILKENRLSLTFGQAGAARVRWKCRTLKKNILS